MLCLMFVNQDGGDHHHQGVYHHLGLFLRRLVLIGRRGYQALIRCENLPFLLLMGRI